MTGYRIGTPASFWAVNSLTLFALNEQIRLNYLECTAGTKSKPHLRDRPIDPLPQRYPEGITAECL